MKHTRGYGPGVIVRGIENRWSRRNAFVLSVVMTGTESKQLGVLRPSTLQLALRRSGRTVGSICLSTLQLALRRSGRTVGSVCLPTLQLALRRSGGTVGSICLPTLQLALPRSQETASPADSAMARRPLPPLKKGDRGGFYFFVTGPDKSPPTPLVKGGKFVHLALRRGRRGLSRAQGERHLVRASNARSC